MSIYNNKSIDEDLLTLKKWVLNKEWSDIKKELYNIMKNKGNNKYITQIQELNDVDTSITRLIQILETRELIYILKKLNHVQNGGNYYNPYNTNYMHGGINYGNFGSVLKSKATAAASKARTQIMEQGKQIAQQTKEYAQQQAQLAKEYAQQQALQGQQYVQGQIQQGQQYIQGQIQQGQQKIDQQLGNINQQLQQGITQYANLQNPQSSYISVPSVNVMPGMPITTTMTTSEPNKPIESPGMVETVFDFFEGIGEKITGF